MKIAIRADGSQSIGMGHVMRSVVLAKELAKTNEVIFICDHSKMYNSAGDKYIHENGFEIMYISDAKVIEEMRGSNADLLITDSYDVDEEYFDKTKELFKVTGYIDDLNKYYYNVDILISHILNSENLTYRVPSNTRLLLGVRYALVREEFMLRHARQIGTVKNIMLTTGGADIYNITEKLLEMINTVNHCYHVVIGPYFDPDSIDRIKRYEGSHIKLHYNPNMYELMSNCDLAITACGGSVYELACSGVPIIGMILSENQEYVCNTLEHRGLIKSIGWHNSLTSDLITETINNMCSNTKLRTKMSFKLQELIDGKGPERIANNINSILNK